MSRNRSIEYWLLNITNQLKAFQTHSSFHANLKKNAAPGVSWLVFLWELKIHIYVFEQIFSLLLPWRSDAACGERGGKESLGLWSSHISAPQPLPGLGFTALLLPAPLFFTNQLVAADFILGCKRSERKMCGYFSRDCVFIVEGWQRVQRLSRSENSPKPKQLRKAPNRHHINEV